MNLTQTHTTSSPRAGSPLLPDALTLGPVHLVVSRLKRSVEWYERSLGLRLRARAGAVAELGDSQRTSIVLHEDPAARAAGRHAGLYHYALLYPSRQELGRATLRLAATRTPIDGASDHRTHEGIYLPDPDGNGIELAADLPREHWPADLGYAGGPAPLDLDALLATVAGEEPRAQVGEGLRVGHLHLHVGDIEQALGFYRDVIGLELQANLGTAAFLSAGGYHHHLGVNVWQGRGVGPAPEHAAGLHHWTVELPSAADVEAVRTRAAAAGLDAEPVAGGFETRDPWNNALRFVEAGR